jgi:Ca2+-binding EF-hand superfamily protein
MKARLSQFEKTVKAKLLQKCKPNESEETVLNKCFKYFDIDDSGELEFEEFRKGLEKVGVTLNTEDDLKAIFDYFDTDKSGSVSIKEFSDALFNHKKETESEVASNEEEESGKKDKAGDKEMLKKLKEKMASRGARGIIGLGKSFRVLLRS